MFSWKNKHEATSLQRAERTMGAVTVIVWPVKAAYGLALFAVRLAFDLLFLPARLVLALYNWIWGRLQASITWTETKLRALRRTKPLALLFPPTVRDDTQQQVTDLDGNESCSGRRKKQEDSEEEEGGQQESLALILDLMALGKEDELAKVKELTQQIAKRSPHDPSSVAEVQQQQQVFKLIQDLQQLASSETGNQDATGATGAAPDTLATLRMLENQLGQFLQEHEEEVDSNAVFPSDLETITEEEFSTASSFGSPSPHPYHCPLSPNHNTTLVDTSGQAEDQIGAALLRMNSSVMMLEMEQTGSASGGEGGNESERVRKASASEDKQRFMDTQNQFQDVIESLNPDTIVPAPKTPVSTSQSVRSPPEPYPSPQEVYDVLSPTTRPNQPYPQSEEIYDAIPAADHSPNPPPPPPRTHRSRHQSDSDSTPSQTPEQHRKQRRRSVENEEDDQQPHVHRRHSHRSSRHHRHRHHHHHHRDSSADSRNSDDDQCHCHNRHQHRPRSRERHHHRRCSDEAYSHRHRDSSSDSRRNSREEYEDDHRRSSSGAESQPVVGTPPSPGQGSKWNSFIGIFKKSTSLTSLSSHKDRADQASISSYKL